MGHKGIVHSKVYEENTLLSQSVYFLLALLSPPRVDKEGLTRPMNLTQSTTQKGLVEEKEHLALQNPFLYELPFLINNFVIKIICEKKTVGRTTGYSVLLITLIVSKARTDTRTHVCTIQLKHTRLLCALS